MRARRNTLAFKPTGKLQAGECRSCGAAVKRDIGFCTVCGSAQPNATPRLMLRSRPGILRRGMLDVAEMRDEMEQVSNPLVFLLHVSDGECTVSKAQRSIA